MSLRQYRACVVDSLGLGITCLITQYGSTVYTKFFELEWEYRDGIKSKGDKIMTACTHSTVIEDARNFQPKRINATSPILSQRHRAESRIDVT